MALFEVHIGKDEAEALEIAIPLSDEIWDASQLNGLRARMASELARFNALTELEDAGHGIEVYGQQHADGWFCRKCGWQKSGYWADGRRAAEEEHYKAVTGKEVF